MESVKLVVEEIKSYLFNSNTEHNMEIVVSGMKKCDQALRHFNNLIKKSMMIGEKQQLITAIGQVTSFKEMFNALQVVSGGGVKTKTGSDNVKWSDVESAFKSRIRTGVITNLRHTDPKLFLEDASVIFQRRISKVLKTQEALKVNTIFCGEFVKQTADRELREFKYFSIINVAIYRDTDLSKWFTDNVQDVILTNLEEFQEKDSGWRLLEVINLQVNVNRLILLVGSSYLPLPPDIARKQACINVKNNDKRCFVWAVVSALYPANKDPQRISKYPNPSDVFNLTGIQFPMTIKQIPRFEKLNAVSINVYALKRTSKKFSTVPTYLSKIKQGKHVNLLLIQDVYYDNDDGNTTLGEKQKYHYVWIKDLSRLLCSQINKHDGKKYFCDRCLHYFYSETRLNKHYEDCVEMNDCKIRLPTEDNKYIKFRNYKNKVRNPFIIYADLECLLVPSTDDKKYQTHVPCSIGYYVKCSYDNTLSFYRSYRGKNCIEWFTKELEEFAENLETVFLCPLPIEPSLSTDDHKAIVCHICEKPFSPQDKKVKDHDHLTGKYRGPAHEGCNINFKDSHTVPIVFHNLSGYDSHFIIKNLALDMKGHVDVLPINKEQYLSFTKHLDENIIKFRFIDSYRFMASGLDTLASFLTKYPELQSQFSELSETKLGLLTRKGVYPYDYFDSEVKFSETKLPDKAKFYNELNESEITDEAYHHACEVWNEFGLKNMGEYSDLYLKTDVLLLADVFEQFRNSSIKSYTLDPAHYYTLPGYTWDCMFKHTNINLELLTDVDMIMLIERGIRGGLSQCSLRYAKANNKYCTDFDPKQPTKYLMYNDINNQYGWAMSQYLPQGEFKWLSDEEVNEFDVTKIPNDADTGYILEVDLRYPQELHDVHSDLPFCPEHRSAPGSKQKKLLATLYDKERYVINYQTLKQSLHHGLKLKKIHRILQFKQSPWLKSYVDLNTKLRTAAKNDFEKNLFKLMNNAVFGKTMENIRKHSIVKLATKWEGRYGAGALIAKPEFKSSVIFDENLVAIELNKSEIYFNKPIYVGMSILDISKTKIYEFHYDYMKPLFSDKCQVAYTDTDSLVYSIECSDIYYYIRRDCYKRFDTSDYPENNIYNIPLVNKKVLGLMKDEMNGNIMTEFVGLRSKMYAIRVGDVDSTKKIKGVKKQIVKNRITFNDYADCLNNLREKTIHQKLIKSEKHNVSSIIQTKIALSPHDNKRYLLKDGFGTLPWGHYAIMDVNK